MGPREKAKGEGQGAEGRGRMAEDRGQSAWRKAHGEKAKGDVG